jgi:hypothetical protein
VIDWANEMKPSGVISIETAHKSHDSHGALYSDGNLFKSLLSNYLLVLTFSGRTFYTQVMSSGRVFPSVYNLETVVALVLLGNAKLANCLIHQTCHFSLNVMLTQMKSTLHSDDTSITLLNQYANILQD